MKKIFLVLICWALTLGAVGVTEATLIVCGTDTLGNQLIYDTDRKSLGMITIAMIALIARIMSGRSNWNGLDV